MGSGSGRDLSVDRSLASLLWPEAHDSEPEPSGQIPSSLRGDLDLGPLVRELAGRESHREQHVWKLLTGLCVDPDVIRYRQAVVTNLLDEPELYGRLRGLLDELSPLLRDRPRSLFGTEWSVSEIVTRLGELEMYVDAALSVLRALEGTPLRAPALRALSDSIASLVGSAEFEALRAQLPALRSQLDALQSVTIGVNLSSGFQPESATILSLDSERVDGRNGLLGRLLGSDAGRRGITRLRGEAGRGIGSFFPPMRGDGRGRENELVADLQALLEQVVEPVGKALERYVTLHVRDFARLEAELAFLLNGTALVMRLREAGLPACCPDIAPMEERTAEVQGAYNISLALRMLGGDAPGDLPAMVKNDIVFDTDRGRVWVLTGPNRGGKTTYVRAIGLAHLLFQVGLYVPAAVARMSPVDRIFTHFPGQEGATPGKGRLDEEAQRLAEIFRVANPTSLILLNEVLSGTSTLEALALARDAVRGLHLLGARAVYVTHLHELPELAADVNRTTDGDGTVGSLVAEVSEDGTPEHRRTFRIRPGPPRGTSYASEIAEQHGISYPQLRRLLERRGLLEDEPLSESREAL
jgi:hypothetical protein